MIKTIPAITVLQPWASLIAYGTKRFETRSWETSYRGLLAVHAGKKPAGKTIDEMFPRIEGVSSAEMVFVGAVNDYAGFLEDLPLGAVVAVAELEGCYKITEERGRVHIYIGGKEPPGSAAPDFYHPTGNELLFGDWTPGRYAWRLENLQMLPEPIPARGAQGLWKWTGDINC